MRTRSISPDEIVHTARKAIGTPFVHQGRMSGVGMDCAGLLVWTARQLGLAVLDRLDYSRQPDPVDLAVALSANGLVPVRAAAACAVHGRPGMVLLMRLGRRACHLGLRTERGILHADEAVGYVVEHGLTGPWPRRVVTIYQLPGVD